MVATERERGKADSALGLWALGASSAAAAFALLQVSAFVTAGFAFDYPLDDVYIHLSMSEQIAAGGYGVNRGEVASASSSILYPLLLAPFAGMAIHPVMPLTLNALGVVLSGALFGAIIDASGGPRKLGFYIVLIGPLLLNLAGAGFAGMEHSLHVTATLAVGLGLVKFTELSRITPLLVLGCLAGPLLRFEGLGVSLAAIGILVVHGRFVAAAGIGILVLVPLAAFAAYLTGLGMNVLPNSVMVKLGEAAKDVSPQDSAVFAAFSDNMHQSAAWLMLALSAAAVVMLPLLRRDRWVSAAVLALMIASVLLAHLLISKVFIASRYETYAVALSIATLFYLAGRHARPGAGRVGQIALLIVTLAFGGYYMKIFAERGLYAPAAVLAQQGQMAAFTHGEWRQTVAVNDLGYVSYRSPVYVLDLFGLGNTEAMRLRTGAAPDGWADDLVQTADVRLIMIYADWFAPDVTAGWTPVGSLGIIGPAGYLGGRDVTFYAARPEDVADIIAALERFLPDLHPGARFTYATDSLKGTSQ